METFNFKRIMYALLKFYMCEVIFNNNVMGFSFARDQADQMTIGVENA